ncbi:MAG: hypothetical protein K6F48_11190 [Paludibacteraceae bacterium]|nr:hypothetical protein [Paludibacteraceae bacterium]
MERRFSISLIRVLLVLGLLSGGNQCIYALGSPSLSSVSNGPIQATWSAEGGVDGYHLEWTYVNSYGGVPSDASVDFRNGATRIETTGTSYDIPSIYENGKLYVRVRSFRKTSNNKFIYSDWSAPSSITVSSNDNDKMNWQAVVDYCEEGKNKEVMTYYDGTMRARQMLTRNSENGDIIVGETFYDHQGRAAVQALPVPSMIPGDVIAYHDRFNLYSDNNNSLPYDRRAFDLRDGDNDCGVVAQPMTSGSAQYYSPSNPERSGFHAYIPDAEGYPFSQTEYTPDNTGRIRRQGGVGKQYQLGSADNNSSVHPTSYYYGKPTQEDLWKLFGSQCGDFSHYQKNMVVDPNGSIAVSYVDMHGRTVATAMAGENPASLSALDSKVNVAKGDVNLLDRMGVPLGESESVTSLHFLASTAGKYSFDYSYVLQNVNVGNVCMDCNYLLTINIKDECGKDVPLSYDGGFVDTISVSLTGAELQGCTGSQDTSLSFSADFALGNYQITRVLQVDPLSRMDEVEKYLMSEEVKTLRDFIDEQIQLTDFTVCNTPDCYSSCLESNPESYEAYVECLAECLNNQDSLTSCKVARELMINDFNPGEELANKLVGEDGLTGDPKNQVSGGQYAAYRIVTSGDTVGLPYSIFYKNGDVDNFSKILNDAGFQAVVQESGVALDSIRTINGFVRNYRSSWAEYLASHYHPEWNMSKDCDLEQYMQFYQRKMILVETYDEAASLGLLNPLKFDNVNSVASLRTLSSKDLFIFSHGMDGALSEKMRNAAVKQDTVLNMWEVAVLSTIADQINQNGGYRSAISAVKDFSLPQVAYGNSGCSSIRFGNYNVDWDRVWQTFRSLYLTQRRFVFESFSKKGIDKLNTTLFNTDDKNTALELMKANMTLRVQSYDEVQQNSETFATDADERKDEAKAVKSKIWKSCLNQANAQVENIFDDIKDCFPASLTNYDEIKDHFRNILAYSAYRSGSVMGDSSIPEDLASYNANEDPSEMQSYEPQHLSFWNVLNAYNISPNSEDCNMDLISGVLPYGAEDPAASVKPLDECGCDLIMQMADAFETQKSTLPYNVHSAQAYFNKETGVTLQNYNAMLCLCRNVYASHNNSWSGTASDDLKNSGYVIPSEIECNVCMPCSTVASAMGNYQLLRDRLVLGQNLFSFSNLVSAQTRLQLGENLKVSLTNYLNRVLHMSKSFDEYYDFARKCNSVQDQNAKTECDVTSESKQLVALLNALLVHHRLKGTINDSRLYKDIREMIQVKMTTAGASGSGSSSYVYDANPYGYEIKDKETNVSSERECTGDCASVTFTNTGGSSSSYEMGIEANGRTSVIHIEGKEGSRLEDVLTVENAYVDSSDHIVRILVSIVREGRIVHDTFSVSTTEWNLSNCKTVSYNQNLELCKNPEKTFEPEINECEQDLLRNVYHNAKELYDEYIDTLRTSITDQYLSKCFGGLSTEVFNMSYNEYEHHYTLYYYDQAGNLVRTVPPAGVEFVDVDANRSALESDLKNGTQNVFTHHRLETRYVYNSLNQLIYQYMPDHDGFADINSDNYSFDNKQMQAGAAFTGGNEGFSATYDPVANKTRLYRTDDNGENWAEFSYSEKNNLYVVKTFMSGITLAGGENGALLQKSAGSDEWVVKSSGISNDIVGIVGVSDDPILYARDGSAYTSNSGNSAWQKKTNLSISGVDDLRCVDMSGNSAVAVGAMNGKPAIYVGTVNNGTPANWKVVSPLNIYTGKITAIAMDGNRGYMNDENGLLMKTVDGGNTWRILATSDPVAFKDMCMVGEQDLYALKTDGQLMKYDWNNGSFDFFASGVDQISGGDVLCFSRKNGSGESLIYRDNYAFPLAKISDPITDMAVISNAAKTVFDVYCLKTDGLYCDKVVKIENNVVPGAQYQVQSSGKVLADVTGISTSNGKLYVNQNGNLYRLGAESNSVNYSIAPGSAWGVNESGRFVVAANNQIKVVDNTGLLLSTIQMPMLNAASVNGNRAVVVGNNGVVFYSNDMQNFTLLPSLTASNLQCVDYAMVNGVNRAFIGGDNGVLLSFQDGKLKEYVVPEYHHEDISAVRLLSNGSLFLGTNGESVFLGNVTNNMNQGWVDVAFGVNAIDCTTGKVWLVGDKGGIIESEY